MTKASIPVSESIRVIISVRKGHKYIEELEMETIPSRIYRVGGVKFKHERLLVHYEEQYLARFTILEASEPMKLQIRPFLAYRNIHELTHSNLAANTRVEYIENGIKSRMYDGFPSSEYAVFHKS